ncbi:MAG: response regulator, partial [Desulfobulbaceae bacterium]|nr:response regulator [Desulfobulbaceae bacterium]
KLGMTVTMASNGQQALDKLEEDEFDMVLMDIMMPIMDGYEATRRIKEQKRFQALPVIALTAKAMPEDRQICLEAGANDYLAKPIDQERLLSLMRVWLFK